MNKTVGIIGAGAWGTALATQICKNGNDVLILTKDIGVCNNINNYMANDKLPGIVLPTNLSATMAFDDLAQVDSIIVAVPGFAIGDTLANISSSSSLNAREVIFASKTILREYDGLYKNAMNALLPGLPWGLISGPNFAKEVALGQLTSTSISFEQSYESLHIIDVLRGDNFKIKINHDTIGTQISGAMKNVIAVASGFSIGYRYSYNQQAVLIDHGIREIISLIQKLGGKSDTFFEPCGFSDLWLTCMHRTSRNTNLGVDIIEHGKTTKTNMLVEGVFTAKVLQDLQKKFDIVLPLCNLVHRITQQELPSAIWQSQLEYLLLKE